MTHDKVINKINKELEYHFKDADNKNKIIGVVTGLITKYRNELQQPYPKECSNCKEMVDMVQVGEMCPNCFSN